MRTPWRRRVASSREDPYWDAFLFSPPADPNNSIPHAFAQASIGGVNPVRTEVHSPNVMSSQVVDLAKFYGADDAGIVQLADGHFGVVCALHVDCDPKLAPGIGGQTPVMKGLFATFTLAAFIRELGYEAKCVARADAEELARRAGLTTRERYIAEIIETDLPLQAT
jgi:hypothetical protein